MNGLYATGDKIVVLPPDCPDLDGYACALGYSELLRSQGLSAQPWISGPIDSETVFVVRKLSNPVIESIDSVVDADKYVYVDGSDLQLFPRNFSPEKVVEVIDHHFPHEVEKDFPNAKADVQRIGAAATLVTERFRQQKIIPTFDSALLLFCAIHSNTQGLNGSVTTKRDHEAVRWLQLVADIPVNIVSQQFEARKNDILSDLSAAVQRENKTYSDSSIGDYTVAQLEFPGASAVVAYAVADLINSTNALGERSILNMVDVAANENTMIIPNGEFRKRVEVILGKKFSGCNLVISPVMLRKQIVAFISGAGW
nr:DHH family phosphoesterase [uncultured Desulfobacter sp.]